jgi:copper chaperone CopZ
MLKKLFVLPLAIAAAVSFTSPAAACGDQACGQCEVKPGAAAPAAKPIQGAAVTSTYAVEGMHCQNCVNAITHKLSAVPGVGKVNADLAKHTVTVVHAKDQAALPKLQAALGDHFKLAAATAPKAGASDACCEAGGADACKDKPAAAPKAPKK